MPKGSNKAKFWILSIAVGLAFITAACGQTPSQPEALSSPATPSPATATPYEPGASTRESSPALPTLTPSATTDVKEPSTPAKPSMGALSSKEAYRHVEQLSIAIGTRPTGTDKERAAADYIASQLRSYGYKVDIQQFQFTSFEDKGSRLEVVSPRPQELHPNTLFYSSSGRVRGSLVLAGIGRVEDLPPEGVKGKVALVERGGEVGGRPMTFAQKTENVAAAGAVGIIIYNNGPGPFRGNLQNLSPIPAVAISQEEGQALKSILKEEDTTVNLSVDAGLETFRSQNIVAKEGNSCSVLVGGHYDSVPEGPGANDNASGTAVVLELARVARQEAKNRNLCFAAFGGEELGLWGSRRYVESMSPEDKTAMKGMINLDMVGVGDRWRLAGNERLVELGRRAAQKESIEAEFFTAPRGSGSDHASFMAAGIPAVFIHLTDDPNYHTAQDKAEFVSLNRLEEASKIALGILEELTKP